MLKSYFKSEHKCEYYYRGTAGPYLDDFVEWLTKRGYQHQTVRRRICGAARFAQWGQSKGSTIVTGHSPPSAAPRKLLDVA